MWFSSHQFKPPELIAFNTSRVGFIPISSTEPQRIGVPKKIHSFKSSHLPNTALKHFIDGEVNTNIFDCLKLWEYPVSTLIRAFLYLSTVDHYQGIACYAMEKFSLPINTYIITHKHYIILTYL